MIVVTAWRRPDYLAQTLEAVNPVRNRTLVVIDGGGDEDTRGVAWDAGAETAEAPSNLGCNMNTIRALNAGFALDDTDDTVIFLEEDHVLTPDALRMFAWGLETYRGDPDIFSISSFALGPGDPAKFHRRPFFSPGGAWATWRDRWEEAEPILSGNQHQDTYPWDTYLNRKVLRGRKELGPHLSRCRNIGTETSIEAPIVRPGAHAEVYANVDFAGEYEGEYAEVEPWVP